MIEIARMKINGLLRPHWRDVQEQIFRQIAMRVDEADAVALLDELKDEVA